jgi:hypothetical protein
MATDLTQPHGRRDCRAYAAILIINLLWLIALHVPFIHLDDALYITDNPIVRAGLTPAGIRWAFTTQLGGFWMPLTWVSLMTDVSLFGTSAWGFHLTNIILHILNALLVYRLLREVAGGVGASMLAALLFSLHPQRVESVAWAVERKDLLAALFGLLALLAYVRYVKQTTALRSLAVFTLMLASLLSKPMLLTLPLLLLVLDYWPLQRTATTPWPRLLREKLPLFLLAIAMGINTYMIQAASGYLRGDLSVRLRNCILSYALYLRDSIAPRWLALHYWPRTHIPIWQLVTAIAILAAVTALALALKPPQRKPALAGWIWFVIAIFPMTGILQSGYSIRADRFMYFPSLGLIIALLWGFVPALRLANAARIVLAIAAVSLLTWCTIDRLRLWRDPLALYEHDLQIEPDNPVLHTMAGMAARERGLHDDARRHFHRAHELDPRDFFESADPAR